MELNSLFLVLSSFPFLVGNWWIGWGCSNGSCLESASLFEGLMDRGWGPEERGSGASCQACLC